MKKLLIVLMMVLPALVMAQDEKLVDIKDLDKRDGIYYDYDDRPYTGKAEQTHEGKRKALAYFKNGQLHGSFTRYNKQGIKIGQAEYKYGKMDGPQTLWYDDGTLKKKGSFKEGNLHGVMQEYDEKGELTTETTYDNGRKMAVRMKENGKWIEKSREAAPPAKK